MKIIFRIWIIRSLVTGLFLLQVTGCKKEERATITDTDGNIYETVAIGNQVWMAENLKTTRLNNKSAINAVSANNIWTTTTKPAYCWFGNDTTYKDLYGALYNWYAVETGLLCPSGWHVPSHDEFKTMERLLGMTKEEADSWGWRGTNQGTKLKSTFGWDVEGNGSNSSGFSALAAGYRYGVTGEFCDFGKISYWWSSTKKNSTQGLYRRLDYNQTSVYAEGVKLQAGKYVRCVKDSI
jgi:uncharacterized protein (TIGR02145 family)